MNAIIRNLVLNEVGEREQGRQLKATPADRYSKVGLSEAGCPVRFINAGNLEILGHLFSFERAARGGAARGGKGVRMSRGAGSWNLLLRKDNELIRRLQKEANGRAVVLSRSRDRVAAGLTEIIRIN